jgi:hypothetical protein
MVVLELHGLERRSLGGSARSQSLYPLFYGGSHIAYISKCTAPPVYDHLILPRRCALSLSFDVLDNLIPGMAGATQARSDMLKLACI